MNDVMDLQIYGIALIPVISGLTRVFATVGVPRRFLPIISLALGILSGMFYLSNENWRQGLLLGITIGLGASGLYQGVKLTANGNGNGNGSNDDKKQKEDKKRTDD